MKLSLFSLCACLLAVVSIVNAKAAGNTQNQLSETTLHHLTVVKDIRNFARNNPGLKLARLSKDSSRARSNSVRYTLGGRVSNDRLVAQGSDSFAYPAKKDVTIQLTYPESGTGAVVTYVELVCTQDSNDGNAYVVAGGIGQRFISIVIEANQTERFSYNAQFYGS